MTLRACLIFCFVNLLATAQKSFCPILPYPNKVTILDSSEHLELSICIKSSFNGLQSDSIEQMINRMLFQNKPCFQPTEKEADLVFKSIEHEKTDFYRIEISNRISIEYSSENALFYALNSFIQLIDFKDNNIILPKLLIEDYSSYSWRGLHLDVARHFFTVEEVKRYLDLMALYKFNVFHWHLTDDQGWRIESKLFPKLTEIGGWRDSTVNNHYSTKPRTYSKERYGGFYTQEEIKEIVSYASQRFIRVVPEIEMPGHSRAALAAYPEFSCTGQSLPVESLWGVFDDIYCSKEESIQFLQQLLEEFIPLFPEKYIHIGGDEAPKTRWNNCNKCKAVMNRENLKNTHELQGYFIRRMDAFLHAQGKSLIGWDEILEGGLSSNSAVMSWRGYEGGIEATSHGNKVVMCPGSHCYFDHYQGKTKEEPLAIGGYTPLEKVYHFSPVPPKMSHKQAELILGAQGNLWTEYIQDMSKLEYMAFPRAIALSQALWNPLKKPSFTDFEQSLITYHFPILDALNVNYAKTNLLPRTTWTASKKGIEVRFESKDKNDQFHIQLEEPIQLGKYLSSEFLLNNNQPFQIDRPTKTSSNLKFEMHSETFGRSQNYAIERHLALGESVDFITEPSPQYNSGKLTLTDGQHGSRPWKGHEWIGFNIPVSKIELKLHKNQYINILNFSFLHEPGSWIYTPKKILVRYKKGNKTIVTTQEVPFGQEINKLPIKAKLKKLTIELIAMPIIENGMPGEGQVPWTFIDEIVVQ